MKKEMYGLRLDKGGIVCIAYVSRETLEKVGVTIPDPGENDINFPSHRAYRKAIALDRELSDRIKAGLPCKNIRKGPIPDHTVSIGIGTKPLTDYTGAYINVKA